jgi:hypothetical protein
VAIKTAESHAKESGDNQGRKRVHNGDEMVAEAAAKRLVERQERSGFVVMKRPSVPRAAAVSRRLRGLASCGLPATDLLIAPAAVMDRRQARGLASQVSFPRPRDRSFIQSKA